MLYAISDAQLSATSCTLWMYANLASHNLLCSAVCWMITMCIFADPILTQVAARLPETDTFEWYGAQYF